MVIQTRLAWEPNRGDTQLCALKCALLWVCESAIIDYCVVQNTHPASHAQLALSWLQEMGSQWMTPGWYRVTHECTPITGLLLLRVSTRHFGSAGYRRRLTGDFIFKFLQDSGIFKLSFDYSYNGSLILPVCVGVCVRVCRKRPTAPLTRWVLPPWLIVKRLQSRWFMFCVRDRINGNIAPVLLHVVRYYTKYMKYEIKLD